MSVRAIVGTWAAVAVLGCAGEIGDPANDGVLLTSAPEDAASTGSALTGDLPIGSILATTAALNLRNGPGTSNSVRLVMPNAAQVTTVNTSTPSNGWYNIKYNGVTGWSSGQYLKLISSPPPDMGGGTGGGASSGGTGGGTSSGGTTSDITSATRDGAVLRAKSAVGGSYWWGHGKWYPNDVGGNNQAASCTGSCPNCSHSGSSGADCSGYVAKLWQVPASNDVLTSDSHPYSTATFVTDSSQWHTISRSDLIQADALVYNSNGAGHVFLYDSGDGWGSLMAYEAKGCSYGIVHDLRTASTAYHAIRHY
jgi:uncharacterized protein YraI